MLRAPRESQASDEIYTRDGGDLVRISGDVSHERRAIPSSFPGAGNM